MSALTCHAVTEFPIANGRLSAFSSGQSPSVARSHIGAVKNRIRAAQVKATLAANAELIHLYWDIGRAIAAMQEKEGWGAGVIPRLARDITNDLPEVKGFSERNLKRMVQFAAEYPGLRSIGPTPLAQLTAGTVEGVIGPTALAQLEVPAFSPTPLAKSGSPEIVQTPAAQLAASDDLVFLQQLVAKLTWAHNVLLVQKVKDLPGQKPYHCRIRAQGREKSHRSFRIRTHPRAAEEISIQPAHRGAHGDRTHPAHRAQSADEADEEMSNSQSIFVAAEVTRLTSISDFQLEPPHVGCYENNGGVEK